MKIGIIGDAHIGAVRFHKTIGRRNLYEWITNEAFKESLGIMKRENVDYLIIAGDLFDSGNPTVFACIDAAEIAHMPFDVYTISGNHDISLAQLSEGRHCFCMLDELGANSECNNIHTVYGGTEVFDLGDGICLVCVPYGKLDTLAAKSAEIEKFDRKIFVGHGTLFDGYMTEDESSIPKRILGKYELSVLGHIHTAALLGKPGKQILVPGSIMPPNTAFQDGGHLLKHPSVWIYSTDTMKLSSFELSKAPHVHINYVDAENLNDMLESIANSGENWPMHMIYANGAIKNLDNALLAESQAKCLVLSIVPQQMNQMERREVEWAYIPFWDAVSKDHPEWVKTMREDLDLSKEG